MGTALLTIGILGMIFTCIKIFFDYLQLNPTSTNTIILLTISVILTGIGAGINS